VIVFIPTQDEATQDNMAVAGHIALPANRLHGPNAIRANAIHALTAAPIAPFFAISHGNPDSLLGHDEEPAVTTGDRELFGERNSFAFACHTAKGIGPSVAEQGGIWFGFAGPINCLPADPDTIHHFISIVDFIEDRFPGCTTTADASAFINDLKQLTDQAFAIIDESGEQSFEVLHALRDIAMRLRIWLPFADNPVKHIEAFGDPVL
jgi:hypothetical protein|tara:strand:+ start:8629 stop:9252 length:624 start_codon:yes stop_codon:yes gene_type:complete